MLPATTAFLLGRLDHGGLKSAVIRLLFGGLSRAAVATWTDCYVQRVVPARLFAAALAAIEQHRAAGDRLVLLSASPDLFVPQLGRAMGFDEVHCTGVRWDHDVLHGELTTANRRGAEKLQVLQGLRRQYPESPVTGYGNSPPDLLHLQACDAAVYVNAPANLASELTAVGLQVVRWR